MKKENDSLTGVIHSSRIVVHKERYAYLRAAALTETGNHFLIARDQDEITVVTEEKNLPMISFKQQVKWFKLVEVRVSKPFDAVGFIARITRAIADCGLDILVVSTFSKDYFLIREKEIDVAVTALRDLGFPISDLNSNS